MNHMIIILLIFGFYMQIRWCKFAQNVSRINNFYIFLKRSCVRFCRQCCITIDAYFDYARSRAVNAFSRFGAKRKEARRFSSAMRMYTRRTYNKGNYVHAKYRSEIVIVQPISWSPSAFDKLSYYKIDYRKH